MDAAAAQELAAALAGQRGAYQQSFQSVAPTQEQQQQQVAEYEAAAAAAATAVLQGAAQRQSMMLGGPPEGGEADTLSSQGGGLAGGPGGPGSDEAALAALAAELQRQEAMLRQELAALQDGQGWVQDFRTEVWPQLVQLLVQVQAQQAQQARQMQAQHMQQLQAQQSHAQQLKEQLKQAQAAAALGASPPQQQLAGGVAEGQGPARSYFSPSNPLFDGAAQDAADDWAGDGFTYNLPQRVAGGFTGAATAARGSHAGYQAPSTAASDGSELSVPEAQHGSPIDSLLSERTPSGSTAAPASYQRAARPVPPPNLYPAAASTRLASYRGAEFGAGEQAAGALGPLSQPKRVRPVLHQNPGSAAAFDAGGDDALGAFETDALRQQLQQLHLAAGLLQTLDPGQLAAAVSAGAQAQMARRGKRPEPPRWIENPAARDSVIASGAGRDSVVMGRASVAAAGGEQPPPRRLLRRMSSVIRRLLVGPQP
jgi:hypothetical protein